MRADEEPRERQAPQVVEGQTERADPRTETRARLAFIARDSVTLAPSYIVPGLASLITVPILYATLGTGDYGAWALMYAIASGVPQVTTSWLEGLLLRVGHRRPDTFGPLTYMASGVASFAAGGVLAAVLIPHVRPSMVAATATLALAIGGYLILVALLQSRLQFARVSQAAVVRAISGTGLGIAAAALTHDPALAILGLAGGFALGVVLPLIPFRLRPSATATTWESDDERQALRVDPVNYGIASSVYAVGLFVLSVSDRFVLSTVRPLSEVGVYAATYTIADLLFRFVPSIPVAVVRQRVFRTWDRGVSPLTGGAYVALGAALAWAMAGLLMFLVIIGPRLHFLPIRQDLVGPIGAGLAAFVVSNVLAVLYSAQVRQVRLAVHVVTAAAVNVALNVAFAAKVGALGAALATAVSYALFLGLNLIGQRELLPAAGRRARVLAGTSALAVTIAIVAGASGSPVLLGLLGAGVLCLGIPDLIGLVQGFLAGTELAVAAPDGSGAAMIATRVQAEARTAQPQRVLLYAMYDYALQNSGPKVRIAKLGEALEARVPVEWVSGDRWTRIREALGWLAAGGLRRVSAVYVESSTSAPSPFDLMFLALIRLSGRPVGIYFRDAYQFYRDLYPRKRPRQRVLDLLWRISLPLLRRVATYRFAPSMGLASALNLHDPILLPPGTDPSLPNLGAGSGGRVVYVGALGIADGFDRLLAAMEIVRLTRPDARLTIVAPVASWEALDHRPPGVELVSAGRADLAAILASARLCVIPRPITPYTNLAVPIKLMDYLSFGKPIVTTATVETTRLLRETDAGLLVGEEPAALAAGILRVLEDDVLARELARAARALAQSEGQSWGARADAIVALLLPESSRLIVGEAAQP